MDKLQQLREHVITHAPADEFEAQVIIALFALTTLRINMIESHYLTAINGVAVKFRIITMSSLMVATPTQSMVFIISPGVLWLVFDSLKGMLNGTSV